MPDALNLRIRPCTQLAAARQRVRARSRSGRALYSFCGLRSNAAYAQEIPATLRLSEQESFTALCKLHGLDSAKQLDDLVWNTSAAHPCAARQPLRL